MPNDDREYKPYVSYYFISIARNKRTYRVIFISNNQYKDREEKENYKENSKLPRGENSPGVVSGKGVVS
jgi:hypothetical protein